MRGLVSILVASVASDKDFVKELAQMASKLKSLDERPEEDMPQDHRRIREARTEWWHQIRC